MSSGLKSWMLSKKLKDTHISNPFGRHPPSPNSLSQESASGAVAGQGSNVEPRTATPKSGNNHTGSRATNVASSNRQNGSTSSASTTGSAVSTLDDSASPSGSHPAESRANTLVPGRSSAQDLNKADSDDLATPRGTISAGSTRGGNAINPALLRVKLYEMSGLEIPADIVGLLPAWTNDPSSTRPPPVHIVLDYDKTQIVLHAIGGTVRAPVWDKTSAFDLSPQSQPLGIQVYVRVYDHASDDADGGRDPVLAGTNGGTSSPTKARRVRDVLVGFTRIRVPASASEPPVNSQVSFDGAGRLRVCCEVHNTRNVPLSIDDFTLLKVVGKGSFGKVMQVRKNDTRQIYALKTIRKAHIVSRSEVGHTLAERTVLAKINNPFIVPLKFSFQSPEKLYLVLAFVNGGELFHHLQREGRFDLNRSRFYTAELLCALECLHEYNVIYRDLKPENILLDYTGHISLCDFGLCKLNMAAKDRTNTFCGTPEYLAPELLLGLGYTKAVDWWTLGVLFYEMLTGLPPFYDQDTNTMYHKIVQDPLTFPSDMDREAKSLLQGLLERDPKRRLGANGAAEIKAHPFFRQIDWKYLLNKKYAAPFQPSVVSATDTSNFDQEFTSEVPTDSVVGTDSLLTESVQKQFGGWSYTNDSRLASSAGKW